MRSIPPSEVWMLSAFEILEALTFADPKPYSKVRRPPLWLRRACAVTFPISWIVLMIAWLLSFILVAGELTIRYGIEWVKALWKE